MDGVFMYKIFKRLLICMAIAAVCWIGNILTQRQELTEHLIRFHVVANSDSEEDQNIKLKVRDAVLQSIQSDLQKVADVGEARQYLQDNLPKIEQAANKVLSNLGTGQQATATLCREAFDIRHYDTFTLPAGVYESLRIIIGEGSGHNWWCVAYPSLCLSATGEGFEAVAADAGLSPKLADTLGSSKNHKLRFFFLDQLGRLQNGRLRQE